MLRAPRLDIARPTPLRRIRVRRGVRARGPGVPGLGPGPWGAGRHPGADGPGPKTPAGRGTRLVSSGRSKAFLRVSAVDRLPMYFMWKCAFFVDWLGSPLGSP